MNKEHLRPPQDDINWALEVEREVLSGGNKFREYPECISKRKSSRTNLKEVYLDYLNDKPFSGRTEPVQLRDGCILTGLFLQTVLDDIPPKKPISKK